VADLYSQPDAEPPLTILEPKTGASRPGSGVNGHTGGREPGAGGPESVPGVCGGALSDPPSRPIAREYQQEFAGIVISAEAGSPWCACTDASKPPPLPAT